MVDPMGLKVLKQVYARIARRYDRLHRVLTGGSDERGRRMLVEAVVRPRMRVLDCGAGTGGTGLLAIRAMGEHGSVVCCDLSEPMLAEAKRKAQATGCGDRMGYCIGDMGRLPLGTETFDAVFSTYSLCPLVNPAVGAREVYRVLKPGGRAGLAHSTWPEGRMRRWLGDRIEGAVWHWPTIAMGCRAVSVVPELEQLGAKVIWQRRIGVPLWPFLVTVIEKPI